MVWSALLSQLVVLKFSSQRCPRFSSCGNRFISRRVQFEERGPPRVTGAIQNNSRKRLLAPARRFEIALPHTASAHEGLGDPYP